MDHCHVSKLRHTPRTKPHTTGYGLGSAMDHGHVSKLRHSQYKATHTTGYELGTAMDHGHTPTMTMYPLILILGLLVIGDSVTMLCLVSVYPIGSEMEADSSAG